MQLQSKTKIKRTSKIKHLGGATRFVIRGKICKFDFITQTDPLRMRTLFSISDLIHHSKAASSHFFAMYVLQLYSASQFEKILFLYCLSYCNKNVSKILGKKNDNGQCFPTAWLNIPHCPIPNRSASVKMMERTNIHGVLQ